MNRNDIVNYLNTNTITSALAVEMVVDFAKSKGKTADELSTLVKLITSQSQLLNLALRNSTDYFLNKYSINSISKDGMIICYY